MTERESVKIRNGRLVGAAGTSEEFEKRRWQTVRAKRKKDRAISPNHEIAILERVKEGKSSTLARKMRVRATALSRNSCTLKAEYEKKER